MTNTGIYIDLERYGLILQLCLLKTSIRIPQQFFIKTVTKVAYMDAVQASAIDVIITYL